MLAAVASPVDRSVIEAPAAPVVADQVGSDAPISPGARVLAGDAPRSVTSDSGTHSAGSPEGVGTGWDARPPFARAAASRSRASSRELSGSRRSSSR